MNNIEISDIFQKISEILELTGDNPFKIRAYINASAAISRYPGNISEDIKNGVQISLKGIGKDLSSKIKELAETGRLKYYEELIGSIPPGLFELMKLRGVGPKKAGMLYKNFNISGVKDLERALGRGEISSMKGFGEKSAENLRMSLDEYRISSGRFLYPEAYSAASLIEEYMKGASSDILEKISIAGSLRRKLETVGDIDILACARPGREKELADYFIAYPGILRVESRGDAKISAILVNGSIRVDLRIIPEEDFIYGLHHFTGSRLHNEELRSREKKLGYKINEYGIFKGATGKTGDIYSGNKINVKDEAEFFNVFGMQYIPPELREGSGEIEAALRLEIPKLVVNSDIQGVLHIHTSYTDGKSSMEEMIERCLSSGFKYAGISDHSVSAPYANGMSVSRLESQLEHIDGLNEKYNGKIKIFKGIESDILPDGSLDYDEKTLKMLDFVIASVHSRFTMPEKEMTERIMNAIKNPYTTMIGHLTGRLLLERKGYEVDVNAVIDCASKYKTIIELNSNPKRLDIDWRYIKRAISGGVMISINPDAHHVSGFDSIGYGVNAARKGWAEKKDILNTREASEVLDIFRNIRDYKKKLQYV